MNELVMIPTMAREELLWLCLEAVRAQDRAIPVFVFSDRGAKSEDLRSTCRKFDAHLHVRKEQIGYGNSWNVIESMRDCLGLLPRVLHVIEDDTILHHGYLEWVRKQLGAGKYAVALGRIPADIPSTWYTSPCVTWNAQCLAQCLEKVPFEYFADTREEMQKILDAAFPFSKFRYGTGEQDGFFLRCLEFFKWRTAYPDHSMASHVGWWGYNRPGHERPTGTFEERIAICRKVLTDKNRRTELFGQNETEREMRGMSL